MECRIKRATGATVITYKYGLHKHACTQLQIKSSKGFSGTQAPRRDRP